MKNRTIIGIICIVLALVVTFAVAPLVNKLADNRTDIVRLTGDVVQGHMISDTDIEVVTVGSHNLPTDVITKKEDVLGKFAAVDLKKGDYLLPSKVTSVSDSADDVFRTLDGTKQAISVTIQSFAGGLSGKLENGDIVQLAVYDNDTGKAILPGAFTYMKVITTTTDGGFDKDEVPVNDDGTVELPSTIAGMLSYIAKREGVEKLEDSWKSASPTEAQLKMITAITDKCSGTTRTSEYREFCENRTRGSASEFIASALEDHPFLLEDKTYLDYIATRPRTEMVGGEHGLFSGEGVSINLKDEVEKMREFRGNVFTVIMSLKREDAERVQFNSAERWRNLIRANIGEIAEQHRIRPENLRWYAAFHNEPSHPHVHIMLYSTAENSQASYC